VTARDDFLASLNDIREAAGYPALLHSAAAPGVNADATRAALLRRGLMVVAFVSLESFLKERLAELLEWLSGTGMTFVTLPQGLQDATTRGVLEAAVFQARLADSIDEPYLGLIQEAGASVGCTAHGPGAFRFHRYAFGHGASNFRPDDVKNALNALNVKDPWDEIRIVADQAGLGGLPLTGAYRDAYRSRNRAAHRVDAAVAATDLQTFVSQALAIGLGFDAVASRASRMLRDGDAAFASGPKVAVTPGMRFRFVDPHRRGYAETLPGVRYPLHVGGSQAAMVAGAWGRALPRREVLIVRDRRSMPTDWMCGDAP
jgi:hypothetical protein